MCFIRRLVAVCGIVMFVLPVRAEQTESHKKVLPDRVKVAAVQIRGYDKIFVAKKNYDPVGPLLTYIDRAGADKAQLIVFPEYYLGRIKIPSTTTQRIAKVAARNGIYVIVGGWEVFDDGSFGNVALLFDRKGHISGKYYKTHAAVDKYEGVPPWSKPPSGHDTEWFLQNDPEWIMKKGQALPVFDLDFGKVGIMTCYDGWFPETSRVLSLKGAEIVVWINGRFGTVEDFIVKTTMFHNTVSMICTNQAYGAGTMIAQWPTRIVASCPKAEEAYITATLDLASVRHARAYSRNFQQRRPDLYGEIITNPPIWKEYIKPTDRTNQKQPSNR